MSIITTPLQLKPSACQLTLSVNQRVSASPFGGSEQAVDFLNDRWLLSLELPALLTNEGAWREAFIGAMRGQTNTVALYHFARPYPTGTMRGTLTLSSAAAQGASSVVVTGGAGQAGTTLLAGDMIGVSGLLLMVASDCTANGSGVITVPLVNRLRAGLLISAAVTWDKPSTMFRLMSTNGVGYAQSITQETSFDFGEAI